MILKEIQFNIQKNSRGYIVIRVNGEYEQHAHVATMNSCRTLINSIHNSRMPICRYLQISCRRLLDDDEYGQLKEKKQQYYNKGIRR